MGGKNWGAVGFGFDVIANNTTREIVFTMDGRPTDRLVILTSEKIYQISYTEFPL